MATNSYVQVPPDSTGKKLFTQQHTVDASSVQAQVLHLADHTNPLHMMHVDVQGAASIRFSEGQPTLSGLGSLKISNARALGVYESSLDTYEALFSTVTVTGGTSSYTPVESSQVLGVTGTSGSRSLITTNRYHYYQPGSSNLLLLNVATGDVGKTGNDRRWGAFDINDGVFFELRGTVLNAVIRNSVSGSIVETRIASSAWNTDKLDGTGLSGFSINITTVNSYWIDYVWPGRARFGVFAPSGERVTCHVFENTGASALPFMRTGTLPIAFENTNTGATGSASELRAVSAAIYTEADFADYAFWRFADIDKNLTALTTDAVAFSVRTLATYNGKHNSVIVYPETLNVYCDQPVRVDIWQNTAVTGGAWDALASACEINYTGTVDTTGSQRFKSLYFGSGAKAHDLDQYFEKNDEGVMTTATGVPEVWSILVTRLTANTTNASLNLGYKELW